MTRTEREILELTQLAAKLTLKGFKVYLAITPSFYYGMVGSLDGSRVVYFQNSGFEGLQFSGCTVPNRSNGSGWGIKDLPNLGSKKDIEGFINQHPPQWFNTSGEAVQFETLPSYLKRSSHSSYKLFTI